MTFKCLFKSALFALMFQSINVDCQRVESKFASGIFIDFNYAYGIPLADLRNRYGNNHCIGGGLSYQPASNFDYGVKFNYFFGTDVKEDVLESYKTDFGQLIGADGYLTDVLLRERGLFTTAYIGRFFPFRKASRDRSGVKLTLGAGYIEHKIRIQDDSRSAYYLNGDFGRGLDRLANGMCISGFSGYEYKSENGKINFYAGFELIKGFTKNRRQWNYDTATSDYLQSRNDLLLQFKFAWYLPFFLDDHSDEIEY